MSQRIVLTRPDGCVSIVCPSESAIRWMGSGGRWPHATRGWLGQQIERQIMAGHNADVSRRHVVAMMFGGLTSAEALGLIRDRDCAHRGTGIELWDYSQVWSDRWFRDAWRRAEDGGPIWIDLPTARDIQRKRIKGAVDQWNKMAAEDEESAFFAGRMTNGPALIEFDRQRIRDALLRAETPDAVKRVWPDDLPRVWRPHRAVTQGTKRA